MFSDDASFGVERRRTISTGFFFRTLQAVFFLFLRTDIARAAATGIVVSSRAISALRVGNRRS
jgi:hypothetical protein